MNRNQIDFKSLLIGLLAGVCLMVALGADGPSGPGRYQISAYSTGGLVGGVYIVDTQTGAMWHRGPRIGTDSIHAGLGTVTEPRLDEIGLRN
jgi:hypothetical protein